MANMEQVERHVMMIAAMRGISRAKPGSVRRLVEAGKALIDARDETIAASASRADRQEIGMCLAQETVAEHELKSALAEIELEAP